MSRVEPREKKERKKSPNGKALGRPSGTTTNRKPIKKREYELFVHKLLHDKDISPHRREYTLKAVTLLYHGGFRVSEITRLTCDDLCDAVKTRKIELRNTTKTKKPRTAFLTLEAVGYIKQYFSHEIAFCGDKLVFHGRGGSYNQVSVASFTEQINKLLKKYLKGNYSSHSFRAGLITELIKSHGVKYAQQIIGHTNMSTTLGYQHIEEEDLFEAMENVRG